MRLPPIKKYLSGKRALLALSLAFVAYDVGPRLVGGRAEPAVVHSESSTSVSAPGRELTTYRWELFPSPTEAAEHFDRWLGWATEYKEFSPCFDSEGRRTGERALILLLPPYSREPTWSIVWTYRAEKYSQLFSVASVSEKDARYYEETERQKPHNGPGWETCAPGR